MKAVNFKDAVELIVEACDIHAQLYRNHGRSGYAALLSSAEMLELALRLAHALAVEDKQ